MTVLKVFVDGELLPDRPFNSVKIVVEGLGNDEKTELHVDCNHEGITYDAVQDDETVETEWSTWQDVLEEMAVLGEEEG